MAIPVIMPQVGQDIKTARILAWHVKAGDTVEKGDVIALVESDKASFEVEAFETGTIIQLLFGEGDEAEVFKPIAFIGTPGETAKEQEGDSEKQNQLLLTNRGNNGQGLITSASQGITNQSLNSPEPSKGKILATPSARRLAKERNLDISKMKGTGPAGRVIKRDILAGRDKLDTKIHISPLAEEIARLENVTFSSVTGTGFGGRITKSDIFEYIVRNRIFPARIHPELKATKASDQVVMFSRMRKRMAERLMQSKETKPHFYLFSDMDFTAVLAWKAAYELEKGIKISVNDVIIQVVGNTLPEFPRLNAHADSEKLILKRDINIGLAIAVEEGLLVPVIPSAERKSIEEIAKLSKSLAENAKKGIVDIKHEGTFTISNLGMFGITGFQAIINPPECAILSVGAVEKRMVPGDNSYLVRDYVTIGLACDHRAVDGAYGAAFLKTLKERFAGYPLKY